VESDLHPYRDKKSCEASFDAQTGWSKTFLTSPSAPSQGCLRRYFLEVASTPPAEAVVFQNSPRTPAGCVIPVNTQRRVSQKTLHPALMYLHASSVASPKGCRELSPGYAFFAYPGKTSPRAFPSVLHFYLGQFCLRRRGIAAVFRFHPGFRVRDSTPASVKRSISLSAYPSFSSTSRLFSPNSGGAASTVPGVSESFTGIPSTRSGP
jgi:hypothetical protein